MNAHHEMSHDEIARTRLEGLRRAGRRILSPQAIRELVSGINGSSR